MEKLILGAIMIILFCCLAMDRTTYRETLTTKASPLVVKKVATTTKTVQNVAKKVIDKIKKSVKDGKTSKTEGKNAIQNVKSSVAGVSDKSDAKSVIQKLKKTGGSNDLYKYLDENIDYYKERKNSGRGGRVLNSKMDGFYYFDKDLPIGQQLVSNVMKQKSTVQKSDEVSKLHDQCKKMKNCSDLKNQSKDRGCGYCGATQKFLMGNSNAPFTDTCTGGWAFSSTICQKNKAKQVCNNITNCLGINVENETKSCGWCKGKKKAYVTKTKDGASVPAYSDDTCNTALLGPGKCNNSDICGGANYDKGPHSVDCLRKMWKDVGCSASSSVSKNMGTLTKDPVKQWNKQSTQKVFNAMTEYKKKADKKNKEYYQLCYGKKMKEGFHSCDKDEVFGDRMYISSTLRRCQNA
jgi:hypothetical protein